MKKITGRSAFLSILQSEGVTHLFGNPGTTELPIMHALKEYPEKIKKVAIFDWDVHRNLYLFMFK